MSFSAVRLVAFSVSCASWDEMFTFSLIVLCVVAAIWEWAAFLNSPATFSTLSIISF